MIQINRICTEQRNPSTMHIDEAESAEILRLMNEEDKNVALAVEAVLPQITKAVDVIAAALHDGGRLIYCGCGTSGRLGVLDAVECPPTFGTDPGLIRALIAGGDRAFVSAVEGAEDNRQWGAEDLSEIGFCKHDVLVGIAASGRTPYVMGAMEFAKKQGAAVIAVTCCPGSEVDRFADIGIAPAPGPEVVTGSTRLKSGTAQKMVLNMLSTASMIKLGKVYENLMVDVRATNEKLVERAVSIVRSATGSDDETAREALSACGFSAKTAILMLLCHIDAASAEETLSKADGRISRAVQLRRLGA